MKALFITTPAPRVEEELNGLLETLRVQYGTEYACYGQEAIFLVSDNIYPDFIREIEESLEEVAVFDGKPDYETLSNQII